MYMYMPTITVSLQVVQLATKGYIKLPIPNLIDDNYDGTGMELASSLQPKI